ncbi:MAG: hypothetical protein ACXQTC_00760, partial [Methanopyraceae archaeon]
PRRRVLASNHSQDPPPLILQIPGLQSHLDHGNPPVPDTSPYTLLNLGFSTDRTVVGGLFAASSVSIIRVFVDAFNPRFTTCRHLTDSNRSGKYFV